MDSPSSENNEIVQSIPMNQSNLQTQTENKTSNSHETATSITDDTNNINNQRTADHEDVFPRKDTAIIVNSIDGSKISDYVIAVGEIVSPENVRYASHISNNTVCIFLSSKHCVDTLLESHKTLKIALGIRRLIAPAKRLIISDVCPSIPHRILENEIKNIGLKLVSEITHLRADVHDGRYSHVLSFQRQVYVSPPEENSEQTILPEFISVNFENTQCRMPLSFEPENFPELATVLAEISPRKCSSSATTTVTPTLQSSPVTQTKTAAMKSTTTQKRPSESSSNQDKIKTNKEHPLNKPSKRTKSVDSQPLDDESLKIIQSAFTADPSKYSVTFYQLKTFLEKTVRSVRINLVTEAKRYVDNIREMTDTLQAIVPLIKDKALKSKICGIMKKLMDNYPDEDSSVSVKKMSTHVSSSQESHMDDLSDTNISNVMNIHTPDQE